VSLPARAAAQAPCAPGARRTPPRNLASRLDDRNHRVHRTSLPDRARRSVGL